MNELQNQNVFSTFHGHKIHLVALESFCRPKWHISLPFRILQQVKSYSWSYSIIYLNLRKKKYLKPEKGKPFGRSLPGIDDISISICLNTLYITVLHNQFCLQRYQGCSGSTPEEFLFVKEFRGEGDKRYFRYKPFNNLSMCLGKDINCTSPEELSLLKIASTDERQLQCFFTRYFINRYKRR